MERLLKNWAKGIPYELAFWKNVYRWEHTFKGMMGWSKYGQTIQLDKFDANAFLCRYSKPIVLDVGCGMSYATGNYIKKGEDKIPLNIHYVDPLAFHFNKILKQHKRELPKIDFGMTEYLSAFYSNANLIIIQNALDHSANPIKGIFEALSVLDSNGILYLNHHNNEAEKEHYKGFHLYNVTIDNKNLVIWNKNERWIVNDILKEFATIECHTAENGNNIAIIRKTGDLPIDTINRKNDIKVLAETIILQNNKQGNVLSAIKFKLIFLLYNIIQFFAQSLPWSLKMRVKKIIHEA